MPYTLRRSAIDPLFMELVREELVLRELAAPFLVKRIPSSFSSEEEAVEWLQKIERKLARDSAYRWLTGRSYPKAVLRKKLEEKKFSSLVSDEVIAEVEKLGYLRDDEFLEALIEKEMRRGYGPRYIEIKLRAAGLDPNAVRKRIDRSKQTEGLRRAISKMKGKERLKMIGALIRRGFDSDLVLQVLG